MTNAATTTNAKEKNMKITFNKANWTGEKATITFFKNGKFKLYGDDYVIIKTVHCEGEHDEYERAEVYSADDKDRKFPVVKAITLGDIPGWLAYDDCGFERHADQAEVALAQVMFNVI